MTVHCVEEPGEAEAEHGAQEKHPEHHFLLQRSHERYVRPQHGQGAQTEEQDQTWVGELEVTTFSQHGSCHCMVTETSLRCQNKQYSKIKMY